MHRQSQNERKQRSMRKETARSSPIGFHIAAGALGAIAATAFMLYMLFVISAVLNASSGEENVAVQETLATSDIIVEEEKRDPVADKVADMTLEEKVAQMFVVAPEALSDGDGAVTSADEIEGEMSRLAPGGVIMFAANLEDPEQTRKMNAGIQAASQKAVGLDAFIAVDEEGGSVARIAGNEAFGVSDVGDMCDVGASGDADAARDVGRSIGGYLSELGFNLDFAPSADVWCGSADDFIRYRSFGTDPQLVGEMVASEIEGFSETGVLSCAKHFPGIGGVEGDSHETQIYSMKDADALAEHELVPFEAAIEAGVPMIMVGHLSTPAISGSDVPASLNADIVTGLLRERLGYGGLVITDSLAMGAVDGYAADADVAVKVVEAGADLVLMPKDYHAACEGLLSAVEGGRISESRIDESVCRIVSAKMQLAQTE